jgi:hypothetical protein
MATLTSFYQKYSGLTHTLAAGFASLVLAYAAVPAFHSFVLSIYDHVPNGAQSAILAALGLYAWYRNGATPAAPTAKTWYQLHKNDPKP